MSEWQQINTAPQDTDVLVHDPIFGVFTAQFLDGVWYRSLGGHLVSDEVGGDDINPTHWMPLPEPPKNETGKTVEAVTRKRKAE